MTDQAQCDELLAALTKRPMTAMEIMLELGIGRPSARIYDLRQQGHPIHSTEIVVKNRKGKPCRVARYSVTTDQLLLIPNLPGRARYTHRPDKKVSNG
jgi:hypothetical protein